MTECPMCHHVWDKKAESYAKLKREIIEELIIFLKKEVKA